MGQEQFDSLGDLVEFDENDMHGEDSLYAVQRPETIARRITFVLFEEIVQTSPAQVREVVFDPELNTKDRELLASVKEHGVITPIVVRDLSQREPDNDGGFDFKKRGEREFALVAGHRRVKAGKAAGLKGTEGVIAKHGEDHELLTLVENMGRRELNSYEEALALKSLQERRDLSGRQVAKLTGLSKTHVHRLFNALNAPDGLRGLWKEGDLTATAVVELKDYWKLFAGEEVAKLTKNMRGMSQNDVRDLRDQLGSGTPLKAALNAQDGLRKATGYIEREGTPQIEQPVSKQTSPAANPLGDRPAESSRRGEKPVPPDPKVKVAADAPEGIKRDLVSSIIDVFPIKEEQGEVLFDYAITNGVKEADVLWAAALYVAQGGKVDQAIVLANEAMSTRWMKSALNREVKHKKRIARNLAECQGKELKRFLLTVFSPLNG